MRKFTLYQAARHSQISRYKLEQAIKEGLLIVEGGKGNIKCFIKEDDLNSFIEEHGDQYRKYVYKDDKPVINAESANFIPRDLHEQMLQEKERIIQILQDQNSQFRPLRESNASDKDSLQNKLEEAISLIPNQNDRERILKSI